MCLQRSLYLTDVRALMQGAGVQWEWHQAGYQILYKSFIPVLKVCSTSILSLIFLHLLAPKAPLNSQTTLIRLLT